MARHYSDTRKNLYRSSEEKRRRIQGERRTARNNKSARREFEGGTR
jgi:hypothetical protein